MQFNEIVVAIVSNNQHHVARDKQSCIKLDIKNIHVFDDIEDLAEPLRQKNLHLLLIDAAIKDMDGCSCLKAVRRMSRALPLPVIMVTPDSSLYTVRRAIAAGCNGYVIRPYAITTFEKHLRLAIETLKNDEIEIEQLDSANDLVAHGHFDEAIREFKEIVEEDNEATNYFNKGMQYLHRNKFGKAILAFNRALALNSMYAEAYKGLGLAHKGKGDEKAYRDCLEKSAAILAMQDRLEELKELFVEILQADPDAINPYNTLGINLRRKGDYTGALHAYTQALELTPRDENLHYNIAKACIFSKDYARAIHHLEEAAGLRQGFQEAEQLLAKLRARQYDDLAPRQQQAGNGMNSGSLAIDL